MSKVSPFRKLQSWFNSLSKRERVLVGGAATVALFFLVLSPIEGAIAGLEDTKREIDQRKRDYLELGADLKRYKQLSARLLRAKESSERSQLTFEQITEQLDRIVKESIGKDDYQLNPSADRQESEGLQVRQYTLVIKAITLEQLIKLLYQIEQGNSSLFLSKLDLQRSSQAGELSASLEIAALYKKSR